MPQVTPTLEAQQTETIRKQGQTSSKNLFLLFNRVAAQYEFDILQTGSRLARAIRLQAHFKELARDEIPQHGKSC